MSIKNFIQNIDDSSYYQDAIKNYQRGIEILKDSRQIQSYLRRENSWKENEEIILLRLQLDWFDCAISILQEEEIFYLGEVKQKAISYLNRYYRPKISIDLAKDNNWRWLMQQKNTIATNVFKICPQGIISLYPAATGLYQMGSSYAELLLSIPFSEEKQKDNIPLKLSLVFRWTEEKMWGEIDIFVDDQKVFSKNQKRFLTLFRIDLVDSHSRIEENLAVNAYGKFFISNNFEKINVIKKVLNNRKLCCTLKLHV